VDRVGELLRVGVGALVRDLDQDALDLHLLRNDELVLVRLEVGLELLVREVGRADVGVHLLAEERVHHDLLDLRVLVEAALERFLVEELVLDHAVGDFLLLAPTSAPPSAAVLREAASSNSFEPIGVPFTFAMVSPMSAGLDAPVLEWSLCRRRPRCRRLREANPRTRSTQTNAYWPPVEQ
jgi:hypothetical protein